MLRVRETGELLALIEAYLEKHKIGATRFGWLATGDMSLVSKLRHKANYDPHMSTVTRILTFLESQTAPVEDPAEGL